MNFLKVFAALTFGFICSAYAARGSYSSFGGGGGLGGDHSLGVGVIWMSPSQDDLNSAIDFINATQSKSVEKPASAYEFNLTYQYRFTGSIYSILFRPSYFMQSSSGSGYDAKLTGYTFFPMFRMYPLENDFIHFFMQTGLGYGRLSGTFSGNGTDVAWAGDAFGVMAGIGADFCFTASSCLSVEGNLRYLPIQRNIISSTSSMPAGFDPGTSGGELERNNMDVKTTLSGLQGALAYILKF